MAGHYPQNAFESSFMNEAKILTHLSKYPHDNVVNLHEIINPIDDNQDRALLVFDCYIAHGRLLNPGKNQNLRLFAEMSPIQRSLDPRYTLKQLVLAVKHLHDHDVAHRDIRPDNIMIGVVIRDESDIRDPIRDSKNFNDYERRRVVLVDFGSAKQFNENANFQSVLAGDTPTLLYFAAPESFVQALRSSNDAENMCDVRREDVWQLCLVFS